MKRNISCEALAPLRGASNYALLSGGRSEAQTTGRQGK